MGDSAVLELEAFPVYAGSGSPDTAAEESQLTGRMAADARVDMQTRGGTRYQSDISVRGGIFEGTGLMVGGLALFDPQTGHYFSEIPLQPLFFSGARLLTGVNNALYGFNSTAGTIDWEWAAVESGGHVTLLAGTDALLGIHLLEGHADKSGRSWQISGTWEEGDGSIAFGDFSLERVSGRLELPLGNGQVRIFGGHLSKFFGWPGMYTGFENLKETEDYHVSLLGWQWETRTDGQSHRIGGYWRELDDDYEFNRFEPNRLFEHRTEVWSLQGDGDVRLEGADLSYRWALLRDRLRRSTSLVNGTFSKREYAEGGVVASTPLRGGRLVPYGGFAFASSDQDSTRALPQGGVRLNEAIGRFTWTAYAEWSESTQLPGYTVLKSAPEGLFGGNPALGREHAETLEGGILFQGDGLLFQAVAFQRRDSDLVDWVFSGESPSARQAAAVDIEVHGLETRFRWEGETHHLELGYAWLDKDPGYGGANVDASFYALNYAEHRVLMSGGIRPTASLFLRTGVEYRKHPRNLLREGGDEALFVDAQILWRPPFREDTDVVLRVENLTNETFEPVPGTPGPGRTASLTIRRHW